MLFRSEMNQISDISASGMKDQQLQITHIATAMTEMKAAVADVARNTEDSANQANEANRRTQHGVRETQGMVDAIHEVSNVIGAAGDTVAELEQQSNKINVIVDVIRDIADQTNLLALNAAIEAARAGESGRGFAVVADEVRMLAARTQDSTQEIQTIIEELQAQSGLANDSMQVSLDKLSRNNELTQQANEALVGITESVANINDSNTQVATAAEEQSQVTQDINRNVVNMSELVNQNVAGISQSASASTELSLLAEKQKEQLSFFKL